MTLQDLGFDEWFQQKHADHSSSEWQPARITRVDRDRYLVRDAEKEIPAELTGRLLFFAESSEDVPCVGDWVNVQYHSDSSSAIIHDLLPRRSLLRRKSPGKKIEYQLLAANVDVAFIMQACDNDFNIRRMERYLVVVREGGVLPIILLTKSDLVAAATLQQLASEIINAGIDADIMSISNETGIGFDELAHILQSGKTYCLLGSSGVGKTTLLNHLVGEERFQIQPVREKDGRGRHTTASRQLILLDNGAMLIDTPGMRELGLMGVRMGIETSFSDIDELTHECRFNDCTHVNEAGCAVLEAVQREAVSPERYRSYMKLIKESEYHKMSYVERRRKDRAFGRMVKSILRNKRKG